MNGRCKIEIVNETVSSNSSYRYHTNTGGVVMQKGLSPNATTRLPLGNPLHGFAIALEIEIIDALGAGTLDILVVMVTLTSFNTSFISSSAI